MNKTPAQKHNYLLFMVILACVSTAMALSDSIFSNYFKEVYHVSAYQRGILEFPRELPGLICLLVIGIGSFLGDIRLAIIAQALSVAGIIALGLLTPMFAVMTLYLFISSLGMHTFMPLRNSIGLSLIHDRSQTGKWLGKFGGVYTAFQLVGGLIVFVGFYFGFFSFETSVKWPFIVSGVFFLAALIALVFLNKRVGTEISTHKKIKLVFDKDYALYYAIAIIHGAQKQIILVFGPWVLIELLSKGAETISALNMIGGFLCMLIIPIIGRWIDRFGIRRMMFFDAFTFIGVYLLYGIFTSLTVNGIIAVAGASFILISAVYVMDKISMSLDLIRVSYLRSIAKSDSDITHTLSTGISMDHVVSVICAYLGGIVWTVYGPQYVFFIAAGLSLLNVYIAFRVKPTLKASDIVSQEVLSDDN